MALEISEIPSMLTVNIGEVKYLIDRQAYEAMVREQFMQIVATRNAAQFDSAMNLACMSCAYYFVGGQAVMERFIREHMMESNDEWTTLETTQDSSSTPKLEDGGSE